MVCCLFVVPSNSHASLPPDGTTFTHLSLGEKQTRTIPPYSFWNFQVDTSTIISCYNELNSFKIANSLQ